MNVPQSTINALRQGQTTIWLIPKGELPFGGYIQTGFERDRLFWGEFRQVFITHYEKRGSTKHFDLWFYCGQKKNSG
jgi:hypothetical protein